MLKKILFFLSVLCAIPMYGQNTKAEGVVLDDTRQPIPEVSVMVKGTTRGTTTNLDGQFSLDVKQNEILVFSFVGLEDQEVVYKGQRLEIIMKPDSKLLEEVVVIGYQTVRKADLTGAVSVFKPELMKNTTVTGTVADALGTLPGLNVRTAGNPGAEGKVEIRGTGTFGNGSPLYVVDGIVSGANRDFNFNDIESIQVLKDASAAAIYGSRAANGVIIITTKQGKEGKMVIDISSRATFQWLPKYNLMGRDEWIKLNDMAFQNAIDARVENVKELANHFTGNTDWQKEVFKTGVVQEHNISFAGGGKESRYFISGNFQDNTGTTIGTKSQRFTLRSNSSASRSFGDNFKFNIGENIILSHYAIDELNTNPIIDVWRMLPTIPIYDSKNADKGGYGFGSKSYDVAFGANPFAKEDFENTKNKNLRIRGNAFSEIEFFKMFKYKFNFGFDFSNDYHQYLRKVGDWTLNQPYDPSSLNKNQAQSSSLIFDNTLEFNKTFGKHSVSAVVGTSFENINYEQLWGTKNDVLMNGPEYFEQLDATLSNPKTSSYRNMSKLFSVFGRVNYNYDEKYLFSFTMRRDESSKFHPDGRVGYFPSVSAGWRISNEKFFNVSWINDLKIRANYGSLGNANISEWTWVPFINLKPQLILGNGQNIVSGMTQTRLVNEFLKWETITQTNVGFDITILNNKLQLSADYFMKKSKDVLASVPVLHAIGHSGDAPLANAATIENKGIEIATTWRDKVGDFNYSININASYIVNKLTSLGYGRREFTHWNTKSIVDNAIGEWYLIKSDGLFRSEAEVLAHKNSKGKLIQPNAKPGDVRYVDFDDNGDINNEDRQHVGSNTPKFRLGSNITLEYKGIDLMMQFTGAFGHKIYNGPRSGFDRFDDNSNYRKDYDAWSLENPNGKDSRPLYGDSRNVIPNQDRWLENGNYLRLTQLALGYTFPKSILKDTFKNVRAYVNLQNVLTITAYTGLDPEFLNPDIFMRHYDNGAFPNPRAVSFGIQLSF